MVNAGADSFVDQRKVKAVEHMITKDSTAGSNERRRDPAPRPPNLESELERSALEVLKANRELRQHLDDYDVIIQESLDKYHSGMRIRDVLRTMPPADATVGSEVEVIEVFEARQGFRRALVAALLADEMSLEEIASIFMVPIEGICDFANEVGKLVE